MTADLFNVFLGAFLGFLFAYVFLPRRIVYLRTGIGPKVDSRDLPTQCLSTCPGHGDRCWLQNTHGGHHETDMLAWGESS